MKDNIKSLKNEELIDLLKGYQEDYNYQQIMYGEYYIKKQPFVELLEEMYKRDIL